MVSFDLKILVFTIFVGISRYSALSAPCANSNKADGKGVYKAALGGYRDCKFLLHYYPSDQFIGIYRDREYLCTNYTSIDCCTACAAVLTEIKCQRGQLADDKGVFVAGVNRYFDCKYLRRNYDEDKFVGIYKNRLQYCGATNTGCCKTCAKVRYEENCKKGSVQDGKGVFVEAAHKYFECKYLIQEYPEDKFVGIYKHREAYCAKSKTDCCTTCATISRQQAPTTQRPETSSSTSGHLTTIKKVDALQDVCSDNCIWLADGSYGQCNWLLDEVNHAGVYNRRYSICVGGFATGCRKTCAQVLQTTAQPTTQAASRPITQQIQSTTQKTQTKTPMTYSDSPNAGNPVVVTVSESPGQTLFEILRKNLEAMNTEEAKRQEEFVQVVNNIFSIFRNIFTKG